MYEDALSFSIFGTRAYAYGTALMLGCWLFAAVLLWLSRKDKALRQAAAYTCLLALPLGLLLARLLYAFGDPAFAPLMNLKNLLAFDAGGYAMFGALVGVVLAAILSARLTRQPIAPLLDLVAPALMAFIIPARLGEGFTALGISRPLTTQGIADSFLAVRDDYDAYLRTYLLEALIALVILIVLIKALQKKHKPGRVFALGCLLYGISQTLMESLRYDGHLRHSFIGIQQVLSAVLFSVVILWLAIRLIRRRQGPALVPILSLVLLPLVLVAIVGTEFLVDRSQMGKLLSYGLYLLVLVLPLASGILLLKQEDAYGH